MTPNFNRDNFDLFLHSSKFFLLLLMLYLFVFLYLSTYKSLFSSEESIILFIVPVIPIVFHSYNRILRTIFIIFESYYT